MKHLAAVVDIDELLAAPELRERIAAVIDDYLVAAVRQTVSDVFERDRSTDSERRLAAERAMTQRLMAALRYLGTPVHDFGGGPAIAHEVFDDTEDGEHEVVNIDELAVTLTFV